MVSWKYALGAYSDEKIRKEGDKLKLHLANRDYNFKVKQHDDNVDLAERKIAATQTNTNVTLLGGLQERIYKAGKVLGAADLNDFTPKEQAILAGGGIRPQAWGPDNKLHYISHIGSAEYEQTQSGLLTDGKIDLSVMSEDAQKRFLKFRFPKLDIPAARMAQKRIRTNYLALGGTKALAEITEQRGDTENRREYQMAAGLNGVGQLSTAMGMQFKDPIKALQNAYGGSDKQAQAMHAADPKIATVLNLGYLERKGRAVLRSGDQSQIRGFHQLVTRHATDSFRMLQEKPQLIFMKPGESETALVDWDVSRKFPVLNSMLSDFGKKKPPQDITNPAVIAKLLGNISPLQVEAGKILGKVIVNEEAIIIPEGSEPPHINTSDSKNNLTNPIDPKSMSVTVHNDAKNIEVNKAQPETSTNPAPAVIATVDSKGRTIHTPLTYNPKKPELYNYALYDLLLEKNKEQYRNPKYADDILKATPFFTAFKQLEQPGQFNQENYNRLYSLYKDNNNDMSQEEINKAIETGWVARKIEAKREKSADFMVPGIGYTSTRHKGIKKRGDKEMTPMEKDAQKSGYNLFKKGEILRKQSKSLNLALDELGYLVGDKSRNRDYASLFKMLRDNPAFVDDLNPQELRQLDSLAKQEGLIQSNKLADTFTTWYRRFESLMNIPGYAKVQLGEFAPSLKKRYGGMFDGALEGTKFLNFDDLKQIAGGSPRYNNKGTKNFDVMVASRLRRMETEVVPKAFEDIQTALSKLPLRSYAPQVRGRVFRKTGELTAAEKARRIEFLKGQILNMKVTMTYFYAGLVQGESGGRAISNEDFENIYKALWASGAYGQAGSMKLLEQTINGILDRASADKDYIGYGPTVGDTSIADEAIRIKRFGHNLNSLGEAAGPAGISTTTRDAGKGSRTVSRPFPIQLPSAFRDVPFSKHKQSLGSRSVNQLATQSWRSLARKSFAPVTQLSKNPRWAGKRYGQLVATKKDPAGQTIQDPEATTQLRQGALRTVMGSLSGMSNIKEIMETPISKFRLSSDVMQRLDQFDGLGQKLQRYMLNPSQFRNAADRKLINAALVNLYNSSLGR